MAPTTAPTMGPIIFDFFEPVEFSWVVVPPAFGDEVGNPADAGNVGKPSFPALHVQ